VKNFLFWRLISTKVRLTSDFVWSRVSRWWMAEFGERVMSIQGTREMDGEVDVMIDDGV
jgi:hypothetical protein